MPDPTTPNVGLAVPVIGSDVGTWGTPLNNNFSTTDTIFGGVTTIGGLTNAPVSMTTNQSLASVVRFSGVLTGTVVITLGAVVKSWIFENLTTGNFALVVQGNPGTGNVIGLPPGSCQGYWDGTNMNFLNLGKVGEYWDYAGSIVPLWVSASTIPPYLNCDGSTFDPVMYPLLNEILGGLLPDSRGKGRFCLNQGTGLITGLGSGIDGDTIFSVGGQEDNSLDQSNLPVIDFSSANLGVLVATNTTGSGGADTTTAVAATTPVGTTFSGRAVVTGSVPSGGSNASFTNMPPTYIGGISMIRAA